MKINICSNASLPSNLQYTFNVILSPVCGIVLKKSKYGIESSDLKANQKSVLHRKDTNL